MSKVLGILVDLDKVFFGKLSWDKVILGVKVPWMFCTLNRGNLGGWVATPRDGENGFKVVLLGPNLKGWKYWFGVKLDPWAFLCGRLSLLLTLLRDILEALLLKISGPMEEVLLNGFVWYSWLETPKFRFGKDGTLMKPCPKGCLINPGFWNLWKPWKDWFLWIALLGWINLGLVRCGFCTKDFDDRFRFCCVFVWWINGVITDIGCKKTKNMHKKMEKPGKTKQKNYEKKLTCIFLMRFIRRKFQA